MKHVHSYSYTIQIYKQIHLLNPVSRPSARHVHPDTEYTQPAESDVFAWEDCDGGGCIMQSLSGWLRFVLFILDHKGIQPGLAD